MRHTLAKQMNDVSIITPLYLSHHRREKKPPKGCPSCEMTHFPAVSQVGEKRGQGQCPLLGPFMRLCPRGKGGAHTSLHCPFH